MSVLLAVLVVGVGSLGFRLVPLLAAHRLPERVTTMAGWTGLCVLAAIVVRTVAHHQDASLSGPAVLAPVLAPVLASVSVATGLVLAFRGRSTLLAVAAGGSTYLLLGVLASVLG